MRDGGAPVGGVDVAGVAGEEPVVAGEIFHAVLEFAVLRFVEFFDNSCAGEFCALVVRLEIFDEDGEALGAGAEPCGSVASFSGAVDHDPGVAQMELGAIRWVAIVVVEGEAESFGEPGDGFGYVRVDDVGEDGVWRDGAIVDHGKHLREIVNSRNGSEYFRFKGKKKDYAEHAESRSSLRRGRKEEVALRAQGRVGEEIALLE